MKRVRIICVSYFCINLEAIKAKLSKFSVGFWIFFFRSMMEKIKGIRRKSAQYFYTVHIFMYFGIIRAGHVLWKDTDREKIRPNNNINEIYSWIWKQYTFVLPNYLGKREGDVICVSCIFSWINDNAFVIYILHCFPPLSNFNYNWTFLNVIIREQRIWRNNETIEKNVDWK